MASNNLVWSLLRSGKLQNQKKQNSQPSVRPTTIPQMGAGRNLEHTPALVVFSVFIFFLVVSYFIETVFHKLDHYFEHHRLLGLKTALGKVKEELMLMGFCSLVLIVFEENILKICVNIRDIKGIPTQMAQQCPCSYMYFRDFVDLPIRRARMLGGASSSAAGSGSPRSSLFEPVTGPIFKCQYEGKEDDDCGPTWSVLMCCSKYDNLKSKFGDVSMTGKECETNYKIAAGATNVSEHVSGHRLLWQDTPPTPTFSGRRLASSSGFTCPAGTEPFIHQAALHQTHTVIFYIAMLHIALGCSVMFLASRQVQQWELWESYGDDDNEKPELLEIPEHRTGLQRIICSCKEQFTQGVDPASYIAVRRYYISKNVKCHDQHPEAFQFNKRVTKHMNEKFGQILGIAPWMWLTLGFQIVLEGYGFGILNIFTVLAMVLMLVAGAKLQMVNDHLTRTVYHTYNCLNGNTEHGAGCINVEELIAMQVSCDFDMFNSYEPQFWLNDPAIVGTLIKFCIWQIAVSCVLLLYFGLGFEVGEAFHTCFMESRTVYVMVPNLTLMLITLLVSAFRVVPVYCVVSLSANHNKIMVRRRLENMGGHGDGHDNDIHLGQLFF